MKFMIAYTYRRDGLTYEEYLANTQALTRVFAKWAPSDEGFKVLSFIARVSGEGGYILVETDDAKAIYAFIAKYVPWNSCTVEPVLDVAESVGIGQTSLAWAAAAASG
jgi:hypothetical protein